MFKKKKLKNKKNKKLNNIFGILFVFIAFIVALLAVSYANKLDFFSLEKNNSETFKNIGELSKKQKEEIRNQEQKKQDENKINILLLGRGGKLNDAPDLTDSIILASINKEKKTISMFSIPRDLYVQYKDGRFGKINTAYALAKTKNGSIEAGIDAIKYNVEKLTGEKIDYYANIDFQGFISFIDAIGGVEITVPKTLVDKKFPDHNWGYRTFIIKKGTWIFTGEEALNYARSRHSTSDFDRSIRQQQIIKALRKKLASGGFFEKLSNAKKFYDVFKKYVITDIGLSDAMSIFNEVKNNNYKIISSNLNDSCFPGDPLCKKGGFLYTPEREKYGGSSVLLPDGAHLGNINNYKKLEKYIDLVFNHPDIYKENIDISILNSTKVPLLAGNTAFELRKYGFNIPFSNKSLGTIRDENFEESFINFKKDIENSQTIIYLKNIFPDITFKQVDDLEYSLDSEAQIEIIIGKDYKKIFDDLENNL